VQFHLNGFQPGDPEVAPPAPRHGVDADGELPPEVDVLVVGCGPAGLVLAAQLSAFPGVTTRIVERRAGPIELGQADGLACRTVEMFHAFGLSERLLREAYWVNETRFWRPDPHDPAHIIRTGWIQDVEDGLSEFPHVILNQARVHALLLDAMHRSPSRTVPDYGLEVTDLVVPDDPAARVEVVLRRTGTDRAGELVRVRARYVVGCDGARSTVRRAIGRTLSGDSANQIWGVMDLLAVTDFPDVRCKSVIQSEHGNIVLIPREGGYLVRYYIELGELAPGERAADRRIGVDDLVTAARRILRPYTLEVGDVAWWSVYEIGQRLTDGFDDVAGTGRDDRSPRLFIAGDACHTHSPKAGQGMNVSMQDAFNLGWKLAAVLEGRAAPALLHTYSAERQAVAQQLIDFDREWASRHSAHAQAGKAAQAGLEALYTEQGRFTAGVATRYGPSLIRGGPEHQGLAPGFVVGTRFHSAPVVRFADARALHLGHVAQADGRWRLYAFADRDGVGHGSRVRRLCAFLAEDPCSPVRCLTDPGADVDTVLDLRAVVQQGHHDLSPADVPTLLRPRKGRFGLVDQEKVFCPDPRPGHDVFALRGVDRERGCLVIVRPDQYVAHVLPLDHHDALTQFLTAVLRRPEPPAEPVADLNWSAS
jgi:2-polyprenyl-6-methoxyphenol hydroxylase-like FAD-dependent oxidoreductase